MRFPNSFYSSRWYPLWLAFKDAQSIMCNQYHLEELTQLEAWATRKRFGVRDYYRRLLIEVEGRLMSYRVRQPHTFILCEWLYSFWKQVRPRRVYQRGYAKIYSRRYSYA